MNGCCGIQSQLPSEKEKKKECAPLGEIRVNGDMIAPMLLERACSISPKMTSCCAPMARTTWCAGILQSAIPLVAGVQLTIGTFNHGD